MSKFITFSSKSLALSSVEIKQEKSSKSLYSSCFFVLKNMPKLQKYTFKESQLVG